jgi:DNA transposition AAA+ family ATPase
MTLLVESSPNMTPGVLLTELLEQLNNAVPPGLDRKFRELVRVLRGTNYLVIVDEAERLSSSASNTCAACATWRRSAWC